MDININILLVCLFVCLLLSVSKKNVKTAEPIGPKFVVANQPKGMIMHGQIKHF